MGWIVVNDGSSWREPRVAWRDGGRQDHTLLRHDGTGRFPPCPGGRMPHVGDPFDRVGVRDSSGDIETVG
jgi:hypothetical protein